MDWQTYRQLCDQPRYVSRWMLQQTALLLTGRGEPALAALLLATLHTEVLARPIDHHGPPATDMFELRLTRADAEAVRACIDAAVASAVVLEGGRGLGGFSAAWREYLRALD